MVRPNATRGALGTEPLWRRSPQGQNGPQAVLGNPSFSATTKKGTQRVPFFVVMKRWFDENPTVRQTLPKAAFGREADRRSAP